MILGMQVRTGFGTWWQVAHAKGGQ